MMIIFIDDDPLLLAPIHRLKAHTGNEKCKNISASLRPCLGLIYIYTHFNAFLDKCG